MTVIHGNMGPISSDNSEKKTKHHLLSDSEEIERKSLDINMKLEEFLEALAPEGNKSVSSVKVGATNSDDVMTNMVKIINNLSRANSRLDHLLEIVKGNPI